MDIRQRKSAGSLSSSPSSRQTDDAEPIAAQKSRRKCESLMKRGCQVVLIKVFVALLIIYVAVPICFYNCQSLRQHIVFLTFVNIPLFLNLSDPDGFGLHCPQNFYIESEPELKLGTWYIPSVNEACDRKASMIQGDDPVVLYLHGNSGSRGGNHRVGLYKLLSTEVKVHVVAFDYRGYGDSGTRLSPTVDGLVHDALAIYKWLRMRVPAKRIIIWGHSLGTGVATYLLGELNKLNDNPAGLILESPFDELANVVKHHPLSRLHRFIPYFQKIFVDTLKNDPTTSFNSFETSKLVSKELPLLILHAKDDSVIPFRLAEKLYNRFKENRSLSKARLDFVIFEADLGYGHKYIYTHKGIATQLRRFIDEATSFATERNS